MLHLRYPRYAPAYYYTIHLKNTIVPALQRYLSFWKRYVDDTMCFVKIETANYKIAILNNFDPNNTYTIYTYEVGKDCKLRFFDVVLIHDCYYNLSENKHERYLS